MEDNFKKVHTRQDLILSSVTLLAGILIFCANKVAGIMIAICGLVLFLCYKRGYQKDGKGAILDMVSKDICKTSTAPLTAFLNGESTNFVIKEGNEGGSMRLIAYYSKESSIAYVQLFHYSNYLYEPATGVVELLGARADTFISKL